jgi:hypothetical protein
MKFAKMFDNKRYGQIVMIRAQNQEGAPEIRFFVQPDGYGVCSFSIGWNDDQAEQKADEAFKELVPREIIEIVDGWMVHMTKQNAAMN